MEKEIIQQTGLLEFQPKISICFISKGNVIVIPIDEITHVSKWGNATVIYGLKDCYKTYHSLQQILNDLPVNDFHRIHRYHVISAKFINGVKKKTIKVGEHYLPISKYYKQQLFLTMRKILNEGYKTITLHENRIQTITPGNVTGHRQMPATGASRKRKSGVLFLDS